MEPHPEDWDDIIDNGLSRELPGGLAPDLVARIEARVERERALPTTSGEHPFASLVALFVAWLVLAAGLIMLLLSAAPGVYELLLAASRSIMEGARLDLITAAAAALLLTEAAARLIRSRRSSKPSGR